jgi:hypothetical protein
MRARQDKASFNENDVSARKLSGSITARNNKHLLDARQIIF